jgi:hypothetical protein
MEKKYKVLKPFYWPRAAEWVKIGMIVELSVGEAKEFKDNVELLKDQNV